VIANIPAMHSLIPIKDPQGFSKLWLANPELEPSFENVAFVIHDPHHEQYET
jgi:hypothetical protein